MASPSAELAQSVLKSLGLWRLPVDPFEVVSREGIFLAKDDYPEGFDARIEYFPNGNKFGIFYASADGWRTPGRVRFSIGHELGHYYLPEHRAVIRSGKNHNSESDYSSRNPMEQQADDFSADLLMPMPLFRNELNYFRNGFCTLEDLGRLAERLGTSLTSTARRYCEADREPCTIFFSKNGLMHWGRASEDMRFKGMYWCESNSPAPPGSKTAELWANIAAGEPAEKCEGRVPAEVWFKWPKADYLWEESVPLGGTGRVITQLTPDD
jgi:hypothetical protein